MDKKKFAKVLIKVQAYFMQNGWKKVFGTILDRKEAYWDYEIIHLKNTQKFTFFHGFCQKVQIFPFFVLMENGSMAIFPTFFLGNIGQEKVFYDILEKKTPFYPIKTTN